jgi:hypothetical protein
MHGRTGANLFGLLASRPPVPRDFCRYLDPVLAMDFTFNCECGEQLRVATADAGGTKRCRCGITNAVPSLSELRRQAGKQSYEVGIADKLRYMFADGELPRDNVCVECGSKTSNVLECSVECERPYTKGRGFWGTVLLGIFAPVWILGLLNREHKNPEVFGEELIVKTPLPLCPKCIATVRPRKKNIRDLLCRVPLYDQLFQEYPNADADVPP